jgi:hypothetical protein
MKGDPFISLLGGQPKLKFAAQHSVQYTCSVLVGGDPEEFVKLPQNAARIIVTIGCMDGRGIGERPLQETMGKVLRSFARADDGEPDLSFAPFVVALERTRVGACYTILCQYRDEVEVDRYCDITWTMFEKLAKEHSVLEGLVWVSGAIVDSSEFVHLITRTDGRDQGPFPIYRA